MVVIFNDFFCTISMYASIYEYSILCFTEVTFAKRADSSGKNSYTYTHTSTNAIFMIQFILIETEIKYIE